MKTQVVFKKITFWHKDDKETITEINAIFPEHSSTDREGDIVYEGYAHIGQHTEIHEDFLVDGMVDNIHKVETATEEEYEPLKKELESIGYKLKIV